MDSRPTPFCCSVTMISRQKPNEQERKRWHNNYSWLLLSNLSLLILFGAFCITPMLHPKCVIFRHQARIQQSRPWRLHSCCSDSSTYDVLLPCRAAIHEKHAGSSWTLLMIKLYVSAVFAFAFRFLFENPSWEGIHMLMICTDSAISKATVSWISVKWNVLHFQVLSNLHFHLGFFGGGKWIFSNG